MFLARHTFEYELFLSNENLVVATYKELHSATDLDFSGTREQKAEQFAEKLKVNQDKAPFAQTLAHKIEHDSSIPLVVPDYIKGAIRWTTRGQQEGTSVSAAD